MFNNVVLDVFIGLIFIYLLYSLLATVLMELISRWFNLRARMLMKGLRRMLEDHVDAKGNWFQKTTLYNYIADIFINIQRFFVPFKKREKLVRRFYDQPSIKYLGEDKSFSKPGYLEAYNFSSTIVQMLRTSRYDGSTNNESELIKNSLDSNLLNITPETLSHLQNLFADARQDAYGFRARLEQWFDETMQRANGWYKRQTQIILLVLGFIMAWQFNVDTIAISKILLKDKKVREQLVELAISKKDNYGEMIDSVKSITTKTTRNFLTDSTEVTVDSVVINNQGTYLDSAYKFLREDAQEVQHLLGLKRQYSIDINCTEMIRSFDSLIITVKDEKLKAVLEKTKQESIDNCKIKLPANKYQRNGFLMFIGWLLTAFAISLGAPFWFDMLNKIVKLRSSGPRPPLGTAAPPGTVAGSGSETKNIRG